jgi:hypothetical protein
MSWADLLPYATILGLVITIAAILQQLNGSRRQVKESEAQRAVQQVELELLRRTEEGVDQLLHRLGRSKPENLQALSPAIRAAVQHYVISGFVQLRPEATPTAVLGFIKKQDPALYSAWSALEPNREKRTAEVGATLAALREADISDRGGIRIGRAAVPYGVPVAIQDRTYGINGTLVSRRWFPAAFALFAMLSFLSAILTAFVVVASVPPAVLQYFLAPAAIPVIVFVALFGARIALRTQLEGSPEFGMLLGPGTISDLPCFIQFGEYSGTAFYLPPDEKAIAKGGLMGAAWRRYSPNGRRGWAKGLGLEGPEAIFFGG